MIRLNECIMICPQYAYFFLPKSHYVQEINTLWNCNRKEANWIKYWILIWFSAKQSMDNLLFNWNPYAKSFEWERIVRIVQSTWTPQPGKFDSRAHCYFIQVTVNFTANLWAVYGEPHTLFRIPERVYMCLYGEICTSNFGQF